MAAQSILNLPELDGDPAEDDAVAVDDISDGVATRTKHMTLKNFFEKYVNLFGIPAIKVDTISNKAGTGAPNFPNNIIIDNAAPFIELRDEAAPDNQWRVMLDGGGAFTIRDERFGLNVVRISQDAGADTVVIRADESIEFRTVKALDYQNRTGGAALFTLGASVSIINEAVVDDGVVIDSFPVKDGHIRKDHIEGNNVSGDAVFAAINPLVTAPTGVEAPATGGIQTGATEVHISFVIQVSATNILIGGFDGATPVTVSVFVGQGGSFSFSLSVL